MKIRTVKGPLGNRTYDLSFAGRNTIELIGDKRMTREQRYQNAVKRYEVTGVPADMNYGIPRVRATYQIAMRHINVGNQVVFAPCIHPDGSLFYEYVEGSAREY